MECVAVWEHERIAPSALLITAVLCTFCLFGLVHCVLCTRQLAASCIFASLSSCTVWTHLLHCCIPIQLYHMDLVIVASLFSCTVWTQSLLLPYSAVPYGPSHCCLPIQLYQMYSAASCFPIQMYRKDPAIASLSSNHGLVYTVHRSSPASPLKTLSVPALLLGLTKSIIASVSSCTIWTQLYYMDRSIVVSL